MDSVDLFELNEAFAAQSIVVVRELNIPMEKVCHISFECFIAIIGC